MMSNERMKELVALLSDYAHRYYVLDDPAVADSVYDKLYDELISLEAELGVVLPDSPTVRVGGEPVKSFVPHTHKNRLYSLDKCNSFDELRAWSEKITKAVGAAEYVLEYKLDGLTACLTYNGGRLECAATRGNGVVGETVTAQIKTVRSVPLSVPFTGLAEVKGECIMRKSAFEKYNKTAAEPLKNPRNGAAGAVRCLDPKVTRARNLDLFFYDINYMDGGERVYSQSDGIKWLKKNGFKTGNILVTSDIEKIIGYISNVDRASLDFEIDGMVVKVNDFTLRERLGFTDKFPRWAIAYKFEAEETTTKVLDVVWQVGRTGKLTPLALLEPVELCGVTVKRATLNNYGDIVRKNVKLGSTVFIRRSNDVIPEILAAAEGSGGQLIEKPTVCPACGAGVTEEGAHLFCPGSETCRPQIVARLEHFASKDCMDIEGLSEKTVEQFYEAFGLTQAYELYDLTVDQLLSLDNFKDKKANKLIEAICKSKNVALGAFINALGIPNVGKVLSFDLAKKYGSIEKLAAAPTDELSSIDDIGDIVASCISGYFASKANITGELLSRGIKPVQPNTGGGIFDGMKFVLTGSLEAYTRSQAAKLIEERGGEVQSSVTKETAIVVAGGNAGSKLDKAKAAGIRIIGEAEFTTLINT